MNRAHTTPNSPTAAPSARPLEELLTDLVAVHEAFLGFADAHRQAMRRADIEGMESTRVRMADACDRIAALDAERRAIAEAAAPGKAEATLTYLAMLLAEPERSRCLALASTLRELVIRARTDQRRLRHASESMLRHVRGIVQQVRRGLNHAGTYGSGGRVDPGVAVVSGIDMTT